MLLYYLYNTDKEKRNQYTKNYLFLLGLLLGWHDCYKYLVPPNILHCCPSIMQLQSGNGLSTDISSHIFKLH